MKTINAIICGFLLMMGANLFAQDMEMTPYEQKRGELVAEGLNKLVNTMSDYDKVWFSFALNNALEKADGDKFLEIANCENLLYKICEIGEQFQTEANIMAESFNIYDVYTGEILQQWKDIGKWYIGQRSILDKTRTEQDVLREKERIKDNRGKGLLVRKIRHRFNLWGKQGELEKRADYYKRMNEHAIPAFDSLCFLCSNEAIKENVMVQKIKYDPDQELYYVSWNIIDDAESILSTRTTSFHISIEKLTQLKNKGNFRDYVNFDEIYALGIGEYEGYLFPLSVRFYLGGELIIASLDGVQPIDLNTNIINDPDLKAYIPDHSFDISSFLDGIVFFDDAYTMFEEIYDCFNNAYHSDYPGKPFNDYNPRRLYMDYIRIYKSDRDFPYTKDIEKKTYYSIEEINEYRDYYLIELVVELYKWLGHYYSYVPQLGDIIDEICSCDMAVLNDKLLETERLYYAETSKSLREDDLKQNLRQIKIFNEVFQNNYFGRIQNPKEELCKIIVENNEYLKKKIKVKDSYADALYSYYTKHM